MNTQRRRRVIDGLLRSERGGLSVLEFAILAVAIVTGLAAVHVYVRRAVQSKWRNSADQISLGLQYQTDEDGAPRTVIIKH